jgi:DNA topoisomerase-3
VKVYFCEKPSQGRDLAKVLGEDSRQKTHITVKGGHVVTWGFGHLMQQAEPHEYNPANKQWIMANLPIIPSAWKMLPVDDARAQLKYIGSVLKKADEVIIATDADREGEAIAREVLDHFNFRGRISRLWASAQDEASYKKALSQLKPGTETEPLYRAQQARSRADWLVGMNLTRAYTLFGRQSITLADGQPLSVGRVQTPVLYLVVLRDREIENFKPKDYFEVVVDTEVSTGTFKAKWVVPDAHRDESGHCLDRDVANRLAEAVKGEQGQIISARVERKKTPPPLLFSLSTLQKECSSKWGMRAQEVLDIAQKLYETYKLTSYPRSDCNYLPDEQRADVPTVLAAIASTDSGMAELAQGADPARKSRSWNSKKVAESAHHAIIPTAVHGDISALDDKCRKVYDLIRKRYLAQFYPDYEYDRSTILVGFLDQGFAAQGNVPAVAGWKVVYGADADDDDSKDDQQQLPRTEAGDSALALDTKVNSKKTSPPAHYTDGTLLDAMKSVHKVVDPKFAPILKGTEGIGTEATRASIIETIVSRKVVRREKKFIISTDMGRKLIDLLPDSVKSPVTTAMWEMGLEQIARGQLDINVFEREVHTLVRSLVEEVKSNYTPPPEQARETSDCPCCGGEGAAVRLFMKNKNKHVWKCEACNQWMEDVDEQPQEKKVSDVACPNCGKPFVQNQGPKGPFWSCTGYPGCKTSTNDVDGEPDLNAVRSKTKKSA